MDCKYYTKYMPSMKPILGNYFSILGKGNLWRKAEATP